MNSSAESRDRQLKRSLGKRDQRQKMTLDACILTWPGHDQPDFIESTTSPHLKLNVGHTSSNVPRPAVELALANLFAMALSKLVKPSARTQTESSKLSLVLSIYSIRKSRCWRRLRDNLLKALNCIDDLMLDATDD